MLTQRTAVDDAGGVGHRGGHVGADPVAERLVHLPIAGVSAAQLHNIAGAWARLLHLVQASHSTSASGPQLHGDERTHRASQALGPRAGSEHSVSPQPPHRLVGDGDIVPPRQLVAHSFQLGQDHFHGMAVLALLG